LSPHSRHGRHAPASHRRSVRHAALEVQRRSQAEGERAAFEGSWSDQPAQGTLHRGIVEKARRNWFLHGLYDYTKAYLPLFALVPVLLAGLWAWQTYGPKTPKEVTLAERWEQLEQKYSPQRETARQKVSDAFSDFPAQIVGYTDFRDVTRTWLQEIGKINDWGDAQVDVENLLTDGQAELDILDKVVVSKTPEDLLAVAQGKLQPADEAFSTDVALVRYSLGLPAVEPGPTLPEPSANPCISPLPSASPEATGSAAASASPGASASVAASASLLGSPSAGASGASASGNVTASETPCITAPPATPAPTPAEASTAPSGAASASPSPSPSPSPS
jgi:hypothetical protein